MDDWNISVRMILLFYVLVIVLSLPFWFLSHLVKIDGLPDNLPITDVGATFVPFFSGVICIAIEKGKIGIRTLLLRILDYKKISISWILLIILLMPLIYCLTYILMRAMGVIFPEEYRIPKATAIIFLTFFIGAIGEELGYMGYAVDRMQNRFSPLITGLIMGVLWAIWHIPSMLAVGQNKVLLIVGLLATIAFRIIYICIYNKTNKSVFGIVLIHAIGNTGRSIFPGGRSRFEINNGIIGYSLVVLTAILLVILFNKMMLSKINE